jgi:predicted  nucleic acid-binding Zn-ribbon protein
MAMVDTYRNNIQRKRSELAKLSHDKSSESKISADAHKKYVSAQKSASSTSSSSTLKSKMNEMARAQDDIAKANAKIADIDKKIAQKEKEIADEEKRLRTEEDRIEKKRATDEKKRLDDSKHEMQKINSTLTQHSRAQYNIANEQEKMQRAIGELQRLPEKITVLFMASNPSGTGQLRLDEEVRSIQEMIRLSEYRDSVVLRSRWAVRASDILQAINEENPTIIHFSGHGADTGELVLQNPDGSAKFVTKEAITQAISTVSDTVRLVFFNACFSALQAEEITKHVEAAIGMTISIADKAARVFAAQFYSSIGFGLSLEKSFLQAKAALMLDGITEEDTPQLFLRDDADANEITIVKPTGLVNDCEATP